MEKVYINEKPSGSGGTGAPPDGSHIHGPGGFWWDWGWIGGDEGKDENQEESEIWSVQPFLLRLTAGSRLMMGKDGRLIHCGGTMCKSIPALKVYLREPEEDALDKSDHSRCIQIQLHYTKLQPLLNDPEKTLEYLLWPVDCGSAVYQYAGSFPCPEPGEILTIAVAWQEGHWNYSKISEMRFEVFGINSGWHTVPLGKYRDLCRITVDEWRHIKVSGRTARLGRRRKKE